MLCHLQPASLSHYSSSHRPNHESSFREIRTKTENGIVTTQWLQWVSARNVICHSLCSLSDVITGRGFGRPCQMRCWPLIGEAEQKPGSAWHIFNLSQRTREYRIHEHDDCEDVGWLWKCVCLRVWVQLNSKTWQQLQYMLSFLSLTYKDIHTINLSASDTLCTIFMSHTHTHTHHLSLCVFSCDVYL